VPGQQDVDALLRRLVVARRRLDGAGESTDALLRATSQ
jgi:hypothetical protein